MIKFVFGIPLRSRASSKHWGNICQLFEATLRSVLGQSDPDFRVIVACHDVPPVRELADPRVILVEAQFAPPTSFPDQMIDKGLKRRLIGVALRELGGGYLMSVDADDLVSNRLVSFAHLDAAAHGYILKHGYEFDCLSQRIRGASRFNRLCGSSAIIRFDADELPTSIEDERPCYFSQFSNHVEWESVAAANGRPLKALPFRGAVYVMNNGENHSAFANNIGWKRRLLRRLMPGAAPRPAVIDEFALSILTPDTLLRGQGPTAELPTAR